MKMITRRQFCICGIILLTLCKIALSQTTCTDYTVTSLVNDFSTDEVEKLQLTIDAGATCKFTNNLGKSKADYTYPIQVKFSRFVGTNCEQQSWFTADNGLWIDGPTTYNGVCFVQFTVFNGGGTAQTFTMYRTDQGMLLKAIFAIAVSITLSLLL